MSQSESPLKKDEILNNIYTNPQWGTSVSNDNWEMSVDVYAVVSNDPECAASIAEPAPTPAEKPKVEKPTAEEGSGEEAEASEPPVLQGSTTKWNNKAFMLAIFLGGLTTFLLK